VASSWREKEKRERRESGGVKLTYRWARGCDGCPCGVFGRPKHESNLGRVAPLGAVLPIFIRADTFGHAVVVWVGPLEMPLRT
jgi:hypothetical protein